MKTLAKEHDFVTVLQTPPGVWQIDPSTSTNGWRQLTPGIFVSDTYFDLAGLSLQEKTLFFEGAAVQNWLAPQIYNITGPGDAITVMDFMTSSPLEDTELANLIVNGNFARGGSLTFKQTIFGRIRQFVVDVDTQAWGSMTLVSENQVGSLEATASDRIYSYEILVMGSPIGADKIELPQCRHLLRTEAREEKEYEYLMRLKRSYELQQEPDVDGRP